MAASKLGDGGAAAAELRASGERENEMASALGRRARVQDMASSARTAAARGLRGQATGDGWRHAAMKL